MKERRTNYIAPQILDKRSEALAVNPLPQEGGRGIGRNFTICEISGEVNGTQTCVNRQKHALSPGEATPAGPFLWKGHFR